MAGALILAGRARGDDPVDDSDPAPLLKKIGPMMSTIPIQVVEVASELRLIQGPGGNILVLRGTEGTLVVDAGVPVRGKEILETVRRVGGKPVSALINTHWHFDHAGETSPSARPERRSLPPPRHARDSPRINTPRRSR